MKEVLAVGATWTWVPRHIFAKYPGLDEVAQSAGNYLQNASKAEHDGQMLFKIQKQISDNKPFSEIKAAITKNRAKNIDSLPGMYNFLRKYGSDDGKSMALARQTASFIRGESNTARRVGSDLWDILGMDYKGHNQMIRLRHGALTIMYADKNSKPLSAADIKNVVSKDNIDKALIAEAAIQKMADAIVGSDTTPNMTAEFCKFQAACFALLMGKLKVDVIARITDEFDIDASKLELGHLQWHFTEKISKDTKTGLAKNQNPFSAFKMKLKEKDTKASAHADVSCRDNTIDNTANVLQDAGWKVDHLVTHKRDKDQQWKITAFVNGKVKLVSHDEKKIILQASMVEFQVGDWKPCKEVVVQAVAQDVQRPHESDLYKLNMVRSVGYVALHEAVANESGLVHIKVNMKPKKSVEVTEDIAKGKLQLAPQAFKLDIVDKSKGEACESYSNSSMFMGSFSHKEKHYNMFAIGIASAVPTDKSPGMQAPFWSMETVSKESDANCIFSPCIAGLQIKASKVDDWVGNACSTSDVMKVPMIVSSKALKAGDTLKLFVPNKKQKTK